MSTIPPKYNSALVSEISAWRDEHLISEDVATVLINRYPIRSNNSHAIAAVTIIGAVLVGLGVLLYIGSNWRYIASLWKLLIIAAAIVGAHYAGWKFRFVPGDSPKLGSALLLLGSVIFGGGIWLISQMFNLDVNLSTGLLLWFIGSCVSALVTKDLAVGILSSIVLGMWSILPHSCNLDAIQSFEVSWHMTVATVLGLSLALYLRSRAITWITVLAMTAQVAVELNTGLVGLTAWACALWGGYLWVQTQHRLFETPFKYVSLFTGMSAVLFMTCIKTVGATISEPNLAGLLVCAAGTLGAVAIRDSKVRSAALVPMLLLICLLIFQNNSSELIRLIAFNALLLATIFGSAQAGLQLLHSKGLVNVAILFAVLDIICRYFDFFFSMMARSSFFIVGGIILMIAGAFAERGRRQVLRALQ